MITHIYRLARMLEVAGVPVVSVRDDGSVEYVPNATTEQIAQGEAIKSTFDDSDTAHEEWQANQRPERKSLRAAAAQAVTDNLTFLALATPTNAQTLAQVKALTRQMNKLIPFVAKIE